MERPETSMTFRTGHMGNTSSRFEGGRDALEGVFAEGLKNTVCGSPVRSSTHVSGAGPMHFGGGGGGSKLHPTTSKSCRQSALPTAPPIQLLELLERSRTD